MKYLAAIAFLASLLLSTAANAHKPSDSYLSLSAAVSDPLRLDGQWDIAIRDLEHAIGVDRDGDGAVTWRELREREKEITQYAFAHLSIARSEGEELAVCPVELDRLLVDEHVDGAYAVLRFRASCSAPPEHLAIRYSLLFDLDPTHRGMLELDVGGQDQAFVFSLQRSEIIASVAGANRWTQMSSFTREGVWHILHGYDHVLFLITLLLPAVVLYRKGGWQPMMSLRDALLDVIKVVTSFTLAHSLTLSLAVLGELSLPSRWVESAIALSVVLAALNNLFPVVTHRRWIAAFAFGLIHGFGFASVLSDLGLQQGSLALALFSFNLGVELGQLAIVLVLVPIAYWLRESMFYRGVLMPVGAVLIATLAGYWFIERAFLIGSDL
jgi:HupE / UreJ protein